MIKVNIHTMREFKTELDYQDWLKHLRSLGQSEVAHNLSRFNSYSFETLDGRNVDVVSRTEYTVQKLS